MLGAWRSEIVRTIRKPRNNADEAIAPKPEGTGLICQLRGRSALSRISSRKASVAATRGLFRGSLSGTTRVCMQGEIVPFVAGCLFVGFGLLAMQGVVGTLWRSRRFRGRVDGKLIALEALDGRSYRTAAEVPTGPTAPLSFRQVVELSFGRTTY